MELVFRGSFFRDWDNINNKELSKAIEEKKNEVKAAKNLSQISHLKKLRIRTIWYKIELPISKRKIYWILCVIQQQTNRIEFVRLKSEGYFKKNL